MAERRLDEHPTVRAARSRGVAPAAPGALDYDELRALCLAAGADDVGFVEIDRPSLAPQRAELLEAMPGVRALVSLVVRMNREPIRSPHRSVANLEFHHAGDEVNDVARAVVGALERRGVRALNPAMGFPMEMDRFPAKSWVVSHKPVAVAAGLGQIGVHRNVIHPRFGNFVLLGTVLLEAEVSRYDAAIDYNPCLECKLCVAACPVGAIGADGAFDFNACYTHNYREFMSGFTSWVEQVADSKDALDYRRRVSDSESASMWQSLSFGANYKAAYCLAVCPAGEEVIEPFLVDRKGFVARVVRPLQEKEETVYVVAGSDAEAHVQKRFPHKRVKRVRSGIRARSIAGLLFAMPRVFQRGAAGDLAARYHFVFTGAEARQATVSIREGKLEVRDGLHDAPDVTVTADGAAWLSYLAGERGLLGAVLTGKIRVRGKPSLLRAFGRCFPS